MVFKKPGNSRDDKSNRPAGRRTGSEQSSRNNSSSRPRKSDSGFQKSGDNADRKKFGGNADKKSFSGSRKPAGGSFGSNEERPKRSYGASAGDKKPYGNRGKAEGGNDRPFKRNAEGGDRPFKRNSEGGFKSDRNADFKKRGGEQREGGDRKFSRPTASSRTWSEKRDSDSKKPFRERAEQPERRRADADEFAGERPERIMRGRKKADTKDESHLIRLNRYISNAGICSRRKADELIAAGVVSVNGEVVSELGYKVDPAKDVIRYNGETLKREKMVYVLLNKPKDYITTTDDPQERRTVMQLVEKASRERIYPVGRLDRNTTGLLLMTNDGELADKLSHPRNSITKIYQVELNKSLTQGDLNKISFGLELEDGFIKPDTVSYVQGGSKREIGVQIHSGKNRIVRRIFEHLGYEVVKLDRTIYANLTKKDLPRGRWRYLDEKEIIQLKHLVKA
jgi:23S rRNA pseudouridine2605 synthase